MSDKINELKDIFATGKRPTGEDFSKLIEGLKPEVTAAEVDEISAQLAEKAGKNEVRLQTQKISQTDVTEEFLQQMAGTTPINAVPAKDSITSDLLTRESIDFLKHSAYIPITFKEKPRNLFNKNKITSGYEVSRLHGALNVSANMSASDYIPVIDGLNYAQTKTYTGAWYDKDKKFISGITFGQANPLVPPVNAKYVRVSVPLNEVYSHMFEQASSLGSYEPYYTEMKLDAKTYLKEKSLPEEILSDEIINRFSRLGSPKEMLAEFIYNPTKSMRIKLLGDSITHGMGGTGYSEDGEVIPGTTVKMNPNGYCWANRLRDLLQWKFGGWQLLSFNSDYVNTHSKDYIDNTALGNYQFRNKTTDKLLSFDFNGEDVSVVYYTYSSGGIVEVYIDGVFNSTIDSYSSTDSHNVEHRITVPKGNHKLEIKGTNTKNANSNGTIFTFEGIKVNKKTEVVNYAQSGKNSKHFYQQRDTVVESTDDIIMMMLGTNDRHNLANTEETKLYQRAVIDTAHAKGVKVILMSACPANVSADNHSTRNFGMFDVDKAIRELAYEYGMEHISNYDGFLEFSEYRGVNMDTLLGDGLHPNDEGHDVIFRNIIRKLGITYVRPGVTK